MKRSIYFFLFLTSFSIIFLEITLIRFFSFLFYYHYIFLAASIAILGLGIGGSLVYFKPDLNKDILSVFSMFSLIFVLLPFLFSGILPSTLLILSFVSFVCFFLAGIFLTRTYKESNNKFFLYFVDLLGASTGALLTIFLLEKLEVIPAFGFIGIILFLSIIFTTRNKYRIIFSFFILAFSIYLLFFGKPILGFNLKSRKTLSRLLKKDARIIDSRWNAFAKTDLVKIKGNFYIFTDGAAGTEIPEFKGKFDSTNFFRFHTLGFFPFHLGKVKKILIIGPGGGKEVLYGLAAGAKEIDAVEINPAVFKFLYKTREINGNLLNYKNVNWILDEGRRFIEKTEKRYDIIYLPLVYTQSFEAVTNSLIENYIFTKEAFRSYLKHLTKNGKIVIAAHFLPDLLRATSTALEIFKEKGEYLSEALKHIIIVHKDPKALLEKSENVMFPLLLVSRQPLDKETAQKILNESVTMGYIPYFIPYYFEKGKLEALKEGKVSLKEFYKKTKENIKPVTDDSPYFYEMSKNIPLPLLILIGLTSGLLMILFIIFVKLKQPSLFFYFFLTGTGFMLVEIPLIQKLTLPLGYPILSFSLVLFAILLWGGIGSLWGEYLFKKGWRFRIFFYLTILIFIFIIFQKTLISFLFKISLIKASILILAILFPISFLMGIPFPLGLDIAEKRGNSVALAWATSSISSVFGATLSIILSLQTGFSVSLSTGGAFYFLTIFILPLFFTLKSNKSKEKVQALNYKESASLNKRR